MSDELGVTAAMEAAATVLGCEVNFEAIRVTNLMALGFLQYASELQLLTHSLRHHDGVLAESLDVPLEPDQARFAAGVLRLMAAQETKRAVLMRRLVDLRPELIEAGILTEVTS